MSSGTYTINLSWTPYERPDQASAILIYRDGVLIATLDPSVSTFIDGGTTIAGPIAPATTYLYAVVVQATGGCQDRLATKSVTVGCNVPAVLTLSTFYNTTNWAIIIGALSGSVDPFEDYEIVWGTVAGGPYPNSKTFSGIAPLRFEVLLNGLEPSTTYYYKVMTRDSDACSLLSAEASVTTWDVTPGSPVTEPVGGNGVSADYARNSFNGGEFIDLGDITFTEQNPGDIPVTAGGTLIITMPTGWEFRPGWGYMTWNGDDIASVVATVTATKITVTFTVTGVANIDSFTIKGVQFQPLFGASGDDGYILNLSGDPGTLAITGIDQDLTTFGGLLKQNGQPRRMTIEQQPSTPVAHNVVFAQQPIVFTRDQFGNQCFTQIDSSVHASLIGPGTLLGDTNHQVIGGEVDYASLKASTAGAVRLQFAAAGLAPVLSNTVVVS